MNGKHQQRVSYEEACVCVLIEHALCFQPDLGDCTVIGRFCSNREQVPDK